MFELLHIDFETDEFPTDYSKIIVVSQLFTILELFE